MIEEVKQPKKRKSNISKSVLNIIRTTMRNNIELTHIADNKANVLLSLCALMLTFLIPFAIPYIEEIKQFNLGFPLGVLVLTCFVTIYIAAMVLKPGKFFLNQDQIKKGKYASPFFFGNFYQMDRDEFSVYIKQALSKGELIEEHLIEDLHYIGSRLGRKMSLVRIAFNIFTIGLFFAISSGIVFVLIFHN